MNWLGRLFGGVDDAPSVPQWCPGYMGNVGERLELQLTLVDRLMVDRPSTYLTGEKGCRLRFRDAEGHCILLWTNEGGRGTDLKIEEPILARMTVQEHSFSASCTWMVNPQHAIRSRLILCWNLPSPSGSSCIG
jgi:hypothetical protein